MSLTPFVMAGVRPPGVPAALPSFAVRTYVRKGGGRDGLWFLTLEVSSPAMPAARAIGAPYHLGHLTLSRRGDVVTYAGAWRPSYRVVVRPGEPVRPSPRDVWLTSRWRAFTRGCGVLWQTPVEHEPWPLRAARLEDLQGTLTRAAGLPPPAQAPLEYFSNGVHKVRFGVSRPVRPAGRRRG